MDSYFAVVLDAACRELLADNGVDLVDALQRQGLGVKIAESPTPLPYAGTKSVALIILASGASAALVGAGIARVIDALTRHKDTVVTTEEYVPALDASGRPVLDAAGQPVSVLRRGTAVGPSQGTPQETMEVNLPKILTVSLSSKK